MTDLRKLMLTLGTLAGAFSLAACGVERTPQEQAARDARVSALAESAQQRCAVSTADNTYQTRLQRVLSNQSDDTLAALAARDIAVCLDSRLLQQRDVGRRIEMVYYGAARIVSIPDNGAAYDADAWSQKNPAFSARSTMLNRLVNRLQTGEVDADATAYGTSRKPHKRSRRYYWKEISALGADRLRQNPWLATAPARPVPTAASRSPSPAGSW